MSKRGLASVFLIVVVISSYGYPIIRFSHSVLAEDKNGPYVEEVLLEVVVAEDQKILDLQNGIVDMIGSPLGIGSYFALESSENIIRTKTLRNGYSYVTINTEKYPLNITTFRRAIAFALDKEKISRDAFVNLSEPLDSCIPKSNPMSQESQLGGVYYSGDTTIANQLLIDAGFQDIDEDGVIEAPNGSDICVELYIPDSESSDVPDEVGIIFEDALFNLGINYTRVTDSWISGIYDRVLYHQDYDIAFFRSSEFTDYDVDWMASMFWSGNADVPFQNPANFQNATFDSLRGQLLNSSNSADVLEAAREMQEIIAYECPIIVCYQNYIFAAYRTDLFENHIIGFNEETTFWWTNQKVRLMEQESNAIGGRFKWITPLDVDTFNVMYSTSQYSQRILSLLYDSLIRLDPEGNDVLWLADSLSAESHEDNSSIPEGHTRFSFDIIRNATWSDGVPFTADDIAFALGYYQNITSAPLGSFVDSGLEHVSLIQATENHTLQITCNTESYWLLHDFCYMPILPKHVLSGIKTDDLDEWSPDPETEVIVTSGPFTISDYIPGESILLSRNPDYYYRFEEETLPTETSENSIDFLLVGVLSSIGIAIVVGVYLVMKKRLI